MTTREAPATPAWASAFLTSERERLAQVEESQKGLRDDVRGLESRIDGIGVEFRAGLERIHTRISSNANAFEQRTRTRWPTIWSGVAVGVAVVAVGINGWVRDVERLEETSRSLGVEQVRTARIEGRAEAHGEHLRDVLEETRQAFLRLHVAEESAEAEIARLRERLARVEALLAPRRD